MYRCPTCVSLLVDPKVNRCPTCNANLKRHKPMVLGARGAGGGERVTSWNMRADAEASKTYAYAPEVDIDLPEEHRRDRSGRTAAADNG